MNYVTPLLIPMIIFLSHPYLLLIMTLLTLIFSVPILLIILLSSISWPYPHILNPPPYHLPNLILPNNLSHLHLTLDIPLGKKTYIRNYHCNLLNNETLPHPTQPIPLFPIFFVFSSVICNTPYKNYDLSISLSLNPLTFLNLVNMINDFKPCNLNYKP